MNKQQGQQTQDKNPQQSQQSGRQDQQGNPQGQRDLNQGSSQDRQQGADRAPGSGGNQKQDRSR